METIKEIPSPLPKKRGRPRKHPLPTPDAPKKKIGRPKKSDEEKTWTPERVKEYHKDYYKRKYKRANDLKRLDRIMTDLGLKV